ncbi:MAG: hypothetical protein ABIS29_19435, partial [Vicinamibacterales bacterium]
AAVLITVLLVPPQYRLLLRRLRETTNMEQDEVVREEDLLKAPAAPVTSDQGDGASEESTDATRSDEAAD